MGKCTETFFQPSAGMMKMKQRWMLQQDNRPKNTATVDRSVAGPTHTVEREKLTVTEVNYKM